MFEDKIEHFSVTIYAPTAFSTNCCNINGHYSNFPLNLGLVKGALAKGSCKVTINLFSLFQLTDKIKLYIYGSAGQSRYNCSIKQVLLNAVLTRGFVFFFFFFCCL